LAAIGLSDTKQTLVELVRQFNVHGNEFAGNRKRHDRRHENQLIVSKRTKKGHNFRSRINPDGYSR
jgi:thymidine kinase